MPVSEQSNRLGVLAMTLPNGTSEIEFLVTELGLAAAPLLLASAHTPICRTCCAAVARWTWHRDAVVAATPLSLAAAGMTSAACSNRHNVGGDCFDYASIGHPRPAILDTVDTANSAVLRPSWSVRTAIAVVQETTLPTSPRRWTRRSAPSRSVCIRDRDPRST